MKHKISGLMILLSIIGYSCSNKIIIHKKSQFEINQILVSGKRFFVQDSSQYSADFINGLRTLESQYDSVRLIGKYLIFNESDTIVIPCELPLNKIINYSASNKDKIYKLALTRMNYTNIDYQLSINGKLNRIGQIILPAGFIFGDEFEVTGNDSAIPMTQYFDKEGILTCIKIEIENANRIALYTQFDDEPILMKKYK